MKDMTIIEAKSMLKSKLEDALGVDFEGMTVSAKSTKSGETTYTVKLPITLEVHMRVRAIMFLKSINVDWR